MARAQRRTSGRNISWFRNLLPTTFMPAMSPSSRICEAGTDRVVFEKNNSYIEHMKTGRRTQLKERNGVYELETWIDKDAVFGRQGTIA